MHARHRCCSRQPKTARNIRASERQTNILALNAAVEAARSSQAEAASLAQASSVFRLGAGL